MTQTFNRFYNLHIPKTGGTYFREAILRPMIPTLHTHGIATTPEGGGGRSTNDSNKTIHWCWYDEFTQDDSYIMAILRDPAKRIVSHYAWQAYRSVSFGLTNKTIEDINIDNFYKWLEKFYQYYENFQAKNLVYFNKDKSIYTQSVHLGWDEVPVIEHYFYSDHFKNFEIDTDKLLNNLDRINLLVDAESMKNINNQKLIINKIIINLNISYQPTIKPAYGNNNHLSNTLFAQLSEKQINELYEMSPIDTGLYFTKSNFTKLED